MKIWLSKNSEIPVWQQLYNQISLGVRNRTLAPGEKLPSSRELSRRFQIHANTINSAYQKLSAENLIEMRAGSGAYVCGEQTENVGKLARLDALVEKFKTDASELNLTNEEIFQRLKIWFNPAPPRFFAVAEADREFRRILIKEIEEATRVHAVGLDLEQLADFHEAAQILAMNGEKAKISEILPADKTCIFLRANSIADSMKDQMRPPADALIAFVSDWEKFLTLGKMFLVAAGIDAESIITRSPKEQDWRRGISSASLIISDALTAREFSGDARLRVFRILSPDSIREIKASLND